MAIGDIIQRYPLLRLLVFYVCGIGLADVLYPYIPSLSLYSACATALLLLVALGIKALRRHIPYGIVACILFLMLGVWGYSQVRSRGECDWPSEKLLYEARVLSEPSHRRRSVLCEVEVTAVRDSAAWNRVGRKVFAYMEPCEAIETLMPGDVICFRGKVQAPRNFSDSLTFDYARYVTMQGASGTVYLPCTQWRKVGEEKLSLRERMLRLRKRLSQQYMEGVFEGDALGVLSALTLGDKQGLSREVREAYSDAGAAHVLALSGMHVGVIYGMLAFLLRGLLRRRSLRWLRELLIVATLWGFALLVGMSASVVRAVAMCTLYVFARWVSDGSSSSLHVLSLTALLMLLVHPLYLFDVGFQLSFMAMVSILWLEPHLELFVLRGRLHPLWGYLVGVVCMSLAAQLGTFPLVLYHFGSFPVYFLITNLLIVPALFVLLLLMLVWWGLTLVALPLSQPLGTLLQTLIELLNTCLQGIAQWPAAVLHVEGYNGFAVLFSYLCILFAGLFVVEKWKRGAVLSLASLLALLLSLLL